MHKNITRFVQFLTKESAVNGPKIDACEFNIIRWIAVHESPVIQKSIEVMVLWINNCFVSNQWTDRRTITYVECSASSYAYFIILSFYLVFYLSFFLYHSYRYTGILRSAAAGIIAILLEKGNILWLCFTLFFKALAREVLWKSWLNPLSTR